MICRRRAIESPWHGDLRPAPESQSDSEDSSLLIVWARHQNILKLWGQHGENVCWADILRHETRHGSRDPPAWLTVVRLDSAFSLEFPSAECSSTLYSSWFIPTDWSVRAKGGNIMFYSNHCDSFNTPPPLPTHPLFTSQPFLQIELIFACVRV